jgi:hypothetical protein
MECVVNYRRIVIGGLASATVLAGSVLMAGAALASGVSAKPLAPALGQGPVPSTANSALAGSTADPLAGLGGLAGLAGIAGLAGAGNLADFGGVTGGTGLQSLPAGQLTGSLGGPLSSSIGGANGGTGLASLPGAVNGISSGKTLKSATVGLHGVVGSSQRNVLGDKVVSTNEAANMLTGLTGGQAYLIPGLGSAGSELIR